ncbi:gastrula zinc finger protein XlCGF26.1-like [Tribolium castaneum]|uniref:gastrula zinc finger protein XlCGF26.1-like n=1 Tax=Tribolium castaneum TaxID=7070 RepID=UPI0030FE9D4F
MCGKSYKYRQSLYKHKTFECGKPPTFKCPYSYCSYKGQLFTCPDCCKIYARKTSLRNHRKFECGKEATHFCTLCPYKTKIKGNFHNYKYVAGHIHPCTRCGKPYKSKKAMMTHLKFSCENHRSFFCGLCNAAYFYKHHLQRHMKQHQKI